MGHTTDECRTTFQIKRIFHTTREKGFQAWTGPEILKQWFGPIDEFSTPCAEVDLQVGGHYRIQMKDLSGQEHTVVGTYREIRVPEKLVFTWVWEAGGGCGESQGGDPIETQVTVEFHENGTETEIILTHEMFQSTESRDKHDEGWSGCLNRLGKVV